jgi:hypothetical protein
VVRIAEIEAGSIADELSLEIGTPSWPTPTWSW